MPQEGPEQYLRRLADAGDGSLDIAVAALMLAALDHPQNPLEPYLAHLDEIACLAKSEADSVTGIDDAVQRLSHTLAGRFGYDGDRLSYDDPKNADLMDVIERRRGMPVALGILYIHAARALGCVASGLNAPGHFLVRVGLGERASIVDPFNGGASLERAPPRPAIAPVEDQPVSDVEVLLRLENNLKIRAIQADDRARAVEVAERMTLIAPRRSELWFDLARLHEDGGSLGAARGAYETCLGLAPAGQPLHNEAALALAMLKRRLN